MVNILNKRALSLICPFFGNLSWVLTPEWPLLFAADRQAGADVNRCSELVCHQQH